MITIKKLNMLEVATNQVVGIALSLTTTYLLLGIFLSMDKAVASLTFTAVFFCLSLTRSYIIRTLFSNYAIKRGIK